jgi:hypothetical protein
MTPETLEKLRKNAQWAMRAQYIEQRAAELFRQLHVAVLGREEDYEWLTRRYAAHYWEETRRATR